MNRIRPQLQEIRELYIAAETNATKASTGLQLVKKMAEKSALVQAYEGAFEALQAKFSWNAFYQFSQVNKAMQLLNRAVERAPESAEIRYLRFSVNYFLPSFLQQPASLKEDRQFLFGQFPFADETEEVAAVLCRFLKEKITLSAAEKQLIGQE